MEDAQLIARILTADDRHAFTTLAAICMANIGEPIMTMETQMDQRSRRFPT